MPTELVIFDCDGVLVDSETLGNRVLVQFVAEFGLTLELEEAILLFKGCKMADCVAVIEQRLEKKLPQATRPWSMGAIANPDAYAQVYAKLSRLPLNTSKSITQCGARELRLVSEDDIRALQTVADRSYQDEILPTRIEVRSIANQTIWTK